MATSDFVGVFLEGVWNHLYHLYQQITCITGITGIVTAWDAATKTLSIGSTVGNAGNFLWNNNETITGNGSGIVGTIQQIFYPSSVRNEPD